MIKRALTNTGWLMGARGVNAVFSLGYLALATRSLGLAGFGQFVLATTFSTALVGFVSFQTWQVVVRWGQTKATLGDATGFAIALDLLTVVAGVTAAALILSLAGDWLPLPMDLRWATFGLVLVSLLSIRSTPTGILRLHDHYAKAATADSVTSIVRIIGAVVAWLVMPTITGFIVAWAAAEAATAAAYWYFARKAQPLFLSHLSLTRVPSGEKGAWTFVIGTALSGMLLIASRQFLVVLVGAWGGAALAGTYRVAMQIGEGLLKLAQALLRAVYPELVRTPEAAKQIAGRIIRIALATGVLAVLFSVLAGKWVIGVIAGPEFLAAYTPMILLSAAAAVELVGAALEALLIARGRAITNFLLRAIPTALGLLALAWLVADHGSAGAGMAVLGASIATVSGMWIVTRRDERASERQVANGG